MGWGETRRGLQKKGRIGGETLGNEENGRKDGKRERGQTESQGKRRALVNYSAYNVATVSKRGVHAYAVPRVHAQASVNDDGVEPCEKETQAHRASR